jgi:mRNA interferase RelE/StbE
MLKDIEKLASDPRPRGVVKLSGRDEIYRIKVGPGKNYRVLYQIEDVALLVLIVKVGDRKEVYRAL